MIPPNLGVTACCREVFFINNYAEYCVAGTRYGGLGNSAAAAVSGAECAVEETQRRAFTSTFDGLRKIARNEGITTLWRGLSPTLVMTVPANIIYFTGYDWLRYNKTSPVNKIVSDGYAPLVAGSIARIVAAMVVSPIEMFRTRMQASTSTSSTGHLAETARGIRGHEHDERNDEVAVTENGAKLFGFCHGGPGLYQRLRNHKDASSGMSTTTAHPEEAKDLPTVMRGSGMKPAKRAPDDSPRCKPGDCGSRE